MPTGWPHRAQVRVRYHECDMQRVVYNAHYLTYLEDTMAAWLYSVFGRYDDHFDWMLIRIDLEWQGSATFGDVLDIDAGIERFGNTSFVGRFRGSVEERPVFEARVTYVCVEPGTTTKMVIPDDVRTGLGPPISA